MKVKSNNELEEFLKIDLLEKMWFDFYLRWDDFDYFFPKVTYLLFLAQVKKLI